MTRIQIWVCRVCHARHHYCPGQCQGCKRERTLILETDADRKRRQEFTNKPRTK